MTLADAVERGRIALEAAGVDTPRLDAELLACHCVGWTRTRLYTWPEQALTEPQEAHWRALLHRRIIREPLPYLLGEREFYRRSIQVTPDVLIPRPETETLVEGLLRRRPWPSDDARRHDACFADVGTGSGCIGVTLAAEVPQATGVLTDCSEAALTVARDNARRLGVEERLTFRRAVFPDGLDDLAGRLSALVSNPPYVRESERDQLPPEVAGYEPAVALFAEVDGTAMLFDLLRHGRRLLRPGGWIALEFGVGHAEPLRVEAADRGYTAIAVEDDLAGHPRALFAQQPR